MINCVLLVLFRCIGGKTNHISKWKRRTIPSNWRCLEYNGSPESMYENQHKNDGIFFMPAAAAWLQSTIIHTMKFICIKEYGMTNYQQQTGHKVSVWTMEEVNHRPSIRHCWTCCSAGSRQRWADGRMAPRGVNRASVKTGCLQTRYHILSSSLANTGCRTWHTGTHMKSLKLLNWQD